VILLALALLAAHRWPVGQVFLAWCSLAALLHATAESNESVRRALTAFQDARPFTFQQTMPRHALFDSERLSLWSRCLRERSTPELKDRLTFYQWIHCAPNWTDLDAMAAHLRSLGVKDRELICWCDTTHPLYVDLGIRPGLRFMHLITTLDLKGRREDVRQEVIASGHRYVVSDLALIRFFYEFGWDSPPDRPHDLPADFPEPVRDVYPWNQPTVFRAGRFFLHEVKYPIEKIVFPRPDRPGED
jgi:hypothetical protein